jgi:hypothetical protein
MDEYSSEKSVLNGVTYQNAVILKILLIYTFGQWRTGQGVSLPDGKWAPLNIRQYVKNVNDLLVA